MKKRFRVASLVVIFAALMAAMAGCQSFQCTTSPQAGETSVSIVDMQVTPRREGEVSSCT